MDRSRIAVKLVETLDPTSSLIRPLSYLGRGWAAWFSVHMARSRRRGLSRSTRFDGVIPQYYQLVSEAQGRVVICHISREKLHTEDGTPEP
jgi:hypothetical protein